MHSGWSAPRSASDRRSERSDLFENVLIGIDGHQGGRDAVALAKEIAAPGAKLTLAYVYGGRPVGGLASAIAVPFELEAGENALTQTLRESRLDARKELVFGESVGRGLHELAEQLDADLLVVGSTRHALLGRVLLRDDARAALNGAPCAVAIASRAYAHAPRSLSRLGVGYNDSPESAQALAAAHGLAKRYGSTIEALRVIPLPRVQEETPIPADFDDAINALEQQFSARFGELDGVEGRVTYGEPREELAQFAKSLDLLIVGSRGYGPLGRLLHGSVSGYLLGHSSCSLLVLPRRSKSGEAVADA
jgi:nucleotide-binding universal stress UspA family protein